MKIKFHSIISNNRMFAGILILWYFLLAFILYPYLFIQFSSQVPYGHLQDVKTILSIIAYAIHSPISQIYHLPVFYPESFMTARTHPLFGISIFFKLFNWLGFNLEQSNNLYILICLLAGAWGCYLLIKEFVPSRWIAFLLSSFYIIYHKNFLHFVWLNFLSRFYFPFLLVFLIRYLKTKQKHNLVWASLFLFMQFFSSVYYGVLVFMIILPVFFLAAWWLKLINWKDIRIIAIALFIVAAAILMVFSPLITIGQSGLSKLSTDDLIAPAEIFNFSKIIRYFRPVNTSIQYYFPGFALSAMFLFFFSGNIKQNNWFLLSPGKNFAVLMILLFFLCLAVSCNFLWLELLFLLFLFCLIYILYKIWPFLPALEKLMVITLGFFSLFLLKFSHLPLLKSFSMYETALMVLPLQGLRSIQRAVILILPLILVMAAIGIARFREQLPTKISRKTLIIGFIICITVMIYENIINITEPIPICKNHLMKPLNIGIDSAIYRVIPFKSNQIILELPFLYSPYIPISNSDYMFQWRFHQNVLLNGASSVIPKETFHLLKKIIGSKQIQFPNEAKLKKLIQNFSVNYIIFHLNLFPKNNVSETDLSIIRNNIDKIRNYGEVVFKNSQTIVMKIQENIPIKKISRTYSYFHLSAKKIAIFLKEPYQGSVSILCNGNLLENKLLNGHYLELDFSKNQLHISKNQIEIAFTTPIMLQQISLKE